MAEKYLDYSGTDLLWRKISKLLNRKQDRIISKDDSILLSNNEISVRISESENNILQNKPGEGLYVSGKMHKLTFGAGQEFVYDGSEDITVPVYDGSHTINE